METVIDWSKAPKGFPIWLEDIRPSARNGEIRDRSSWAKDDDGEYALYGVTSGWWSKSREGLDFISHQKPAQYNGDGLPPVGTYVVVHDDGSLMYGHSESGEVLAHVDGCAVIRMSYGLGCFLPRCLRTLEQIEAEEREAAIQDLIKVTCINHGEAARVYDAGYRKQK